MISEWLLLTCFQVIGDKYKQETRQHNPAKHLRPKIGNPKAFVSAENR